MQKTVIIGLGTFGLAIGRGIHARIPGQLVGVDPDSVRRQVWQTITNETSSGSIAQLEWGTVRRTFIIVNNESQVTQVLDEIKEQLESGTGVNHSIYVYVVSTVSPEFARRFNEYGGGAMRIVELPMTGGEIAALEGKLTAMVAGPLVEEEETFLRAHVASHLVPLANYGDPAYVKLLNNAVIAYQAAALDEVLHIAHERNIDPNAVLKVIQNGSAYNFFSTVIHRFNEKLLVKDMHLLEKTIERFPLVSGSADHVEGHFIRLRSLLEGSEES